MRSPRPRSAPRPATHRDPRRRRSGGRRRDLQPIETRDVVVADARGDVRAARVVGPCDGAVARGGGLAASGLDLLASADADSFGSARARDGGDQRPDQGTCRAGTRAASHQRIRVAHRGLGVLRGGATDQLCRYASGSVLATMVLAAGLGTRLRPLTDLLPKPIVPVGDGTALGQVLARLAATRSAPIVVNVHHGAARVRAAVQREHPRVVISEERDLLGTGGGLAYAAQALGEGSVLVWNADCLVDVDVDRLRAG